MRRSLLLFLGLFGLAAGLAGCDSASSDVSTFALSGTLMNVSDQAVPGARLTLTSTDGTLSFETTSASDGSYAFQVPGGSYVLTAEAPHYGLSEHELTLWGPERFNLWLFGAATVTGRVRTTQNVPIGNAVVAFRRGEAGATSGGPVELLVRTGEDGRFRIEGAPTGTFTLAVEAEHIVTLSRPGLTIEDGANDLGDAVVTELPPPGALRIVLTWGAEPGNLDAHLTGPTSGGHRFHVRWNNRNPVSYAALDADVSEGFGPEAVTLYPIRDGVYRFSVHNRTGQGSPATAARAIHESPARVAIYNENGLVRSYVPPQPGAAGTTWRAFELNVFEGQINFIPLNAFATVSDDSDATQF